MLLLKTGVAVPFILSEPTLGHSSFALGSGTRPFGKLRQALGNTGEQPGSTVGVSNVEICASENRVRCPLPASIFALRSLVPWRFLLK